MSRNSLQKRRIRSNRLGIGLILICLAFFNVQLSLAQKTDVTGTVSDSKSGETLPGVSVFVEGTNTGSVTDLEGKFKISVPSPNSVLKFSYVGYEVQKITLQGQSQLKVDLIAESKTLDEIVVIGYGAVKKKDLTGSVSSMSGEKIKDVPVASVAEALTGKLAGVQITTTEGSPDADVKIRVRGGGSITRDNSPLYIVDGFPVDKISDIPPTDIQSVDVLKDASSTAIYGARGANGVIIITTKSAKEGKFTVNYSGYYSVKNVPKKLDVLGPYEFAKWQYEQAVLQNTVSDYEKYFGTFDNLGSYKDMAGTNWQDEVFGRTGTTQNHSISINGGTKAATFNASYNRVDDKAVMIGSKYSRDNLNLKLSANPIDWVKLNFDVRYSDTKINGGGANDATGTEKSTSDSRLKNAVIYTPIPLISLQSTSDDPDATSSLFSPLVTIKDNDRYHRIKKYNINGDVTLELMKGVTFRSELAIDYAHEMDNRYFGLTTYYVTNGDAPVKNKPAVQLVNKDASGFRNANILTATKKFDKHNATVMIGEESVIKKNNTLTDVIDNFPTFFDSEKAWAFTTQGTPVSSNNYYDPDDKLLSFFGRLAYDYKGKYLATATLRADGSSKFASGNQWGYFPSAALAWRITDENFMASTSRWLSNLKLRLSYGTAGNNNIPGLSYKQTYSSTSTNYLPSTLSSSYWAPGTSLNNPDLKWETTITQNIGLDFGFFNNRLSGGIELYKNKTKDLLIDFPIAGSGYTSQTRNIGKTSNKGLELTLDAIIVDNKDFRLNFSFNISMNRNKVDDLGSLTELSPFNSAWTSDAQASNDYKVSVGQSLGQMYGYVTDGMYSTNDFTWSGSAWTLNNKSASTPDNSGICGSSWGPGALKLKDLNGDGTISESDRKIIGNALPKHTGGFSVSAFFKGFDFAANFNWVYGNDIYNANKIEFTTANKYSYRNMLSLVNSSNRWSNIDYTTGARVTDPAQLNTLNAKANIWNPGLGKYVFHSWAVEDGSFLRLNNVTLGYTLPKSWMSKLYIQQLRFYVSAYNLFVWTKYSGYDPEVDTRRTTPLTPGVDYAAYPRSRAYNFGVNLTF